MFVSSRGTVSSLLQRSIVARTYRAAARKGVIMCGGWTSDVDSMAQWVYAGAEDQWITRDLVNAYPNNPFPTISCTVGTSWGNSTARTNLSTLKTTAQTALFASGEVHVYGVSQGGAVALNWAKYNPSLVQSIALVLPCVNLQGLYDTDPGSIGISGSIGAAHGGRPADADNPSSNATSFTEIPMKIWYSTTDTVSTYTDQTAFASAAGATAVSMGAVGHAFGSPFSGSEVAAFFAAND